MAAKKKKSSSKLPSKSAFVRGLPATLPAKEVVAKAKAAGLALSDRYVHVIRSIAKRVTVPHEGRVLAEGDNMDQVQKDPRVIDVYLGA